MTNYQHTDLSKKFLPASTNGERAATVAYMGAGLSGGFTQAASTATQRADGVGMSRALVEALAGVDLFAGLGQTVRASIAGLCRSRRVATGQHVLSHRDRSCDVFFVLEGSLRVTLYSVQGREVAFENLGTGAMFGEFAAIDQRERSASVVATSECCVAVLSASAFRVMLEAHPVLAMRVLERLAALSRRLCDRVVEFSTLDVSRRVQREVLRLAQPWADAAGRASVRNFPTHADLASHISTHREAVTREINALERRGLIKRQGGSFCVPSMARLQAYSESEQPPDG